MNIGKYQPNDIHRFLSICADIHRFLLILADMWQKSIIAPTPAPRANNCQPFCPFQPVPTRISDLFRPLLTIPTVSDCFPTGRKMWSAPCNKVFFFESSWWMLGHEFQPLPCYGCSIVIIDCWASGCETLTLSPSPVTLINSWFPNVIPKFSNGRARYMSQRDIRGDSCGILPFRRSKTKNKVLEVVQECDSKI